MIKEIDLRALIVNNLKCEDHDMSPSSIGLDDTTNLIERPFEKDKKWNKKQKTNYIESVFLNCSLQPIIRFKNDNHTVIVDGYNRYLTLKQFYNNEFKLDEKGLNQLKFLANKEYYDLTENEKQFFSKNACIKAIDYYCKFDSIDKETLNNEEEFEILRYLYTIYNTGLKLEIEEIQRAQFYDDYITKKLRTKLEEDEEFLELMEKLKLYNGRRKRNKIENILLNCRVLISSTYSNIHNFSYTQDIQTRIEENYLPNIHNLNKSKIFEDFIVNVTQIYNNLINTQKWEKYSILHSKPFIEATYWLISVIRKDNLINPFSFDFMKYLEYFGEIEESEKNFDIYYAHYGKSIYKKYYAVAKYFENNYNVKMNSYFRDDIPKNNTTEIINSVEELYKRNLNFTPEKVQISNLLTELQNSSYNLRPYYQRKEIMNTTLSSKIIESILLGIRIPYILTCDKYRSGNYVTEVVDGQQRLLSILALLESPFMNENDELEYSNKNGYSLKNLRILSELNNLSLKKKKKGNILDSTYVNKIKNSYLYIYRTKDTDGNSIDTIDCFVRVNKSASIIKENTYRMISLTSDRRIIDYCISSVKDFVGNLLPKENKNGKPYIITLRLAYLFYNNLYSEINYDNYRNAKVGYWLNEFNKFKDKNINSNVDEIEKLRINYYNSINETKRFLFKLNNFLNKVDKSIEDLVSVSNPSRIPFSYYYYLFCLLANIKESILLDNCLKIYNIIESFFSEIKINNLNNNDIIPSLDFTVQQILAFDTIKN